MSFPLWSIYLANHLWQSTLFALLAAFLTLGMRQNRARSRYWLWLAASLKFLLPFSSLVTAGTQLKIRSAPPAADPGLPTMVQELGQPFSAASHAAAPFKSTGFDPSFLLLSLWLAGSAIILVRASVRFRRIAIVVRESSRCEGRETRTLRRLQANVEARSSTVPIEPGVFGLFRPVLLLPAGILYRLGKKQLEAIVAHELCHIRARDNLAAFAQTVVQAIFWFHPLVWWLGAKQIEERERACDEEVLAMGHGARTYAEAILQVCRFYVKSDVACVSGVSGSDLITRIESIMRRRAVSPLNAAKKMVLAVFGAAAIVCPVLVGVLYAPLSQAQSPTADPAPLAFDSVSIKPGNPAVHGADFQMLPGGRLVATNVTVAMLIERAYQVRDFQISGGPDWINSARFDIVAKTDLPLTSPRQAIPLIAKLLEDRFHLVMSRETKQLPIYALVVAKGGPKLQDAKPDEPAQIHSTRTLIEGRAMSATALAQELARPLGRTVIDATSLTGRYQIRLQWTPDEAPPDTGTDASLFAAVQELGLKLEARKGPVEIVVIGRIEKPSEN